MTIGLAVAMVACQAAVKQQASVKKDIANLTFAAGATSAQTVTNLSSYFNVSNATFTASSSNPKVATATVAGEVLTVTPVGPGTANVTVVAKGDEGEASQTFTVTVDAPAANGAPTVRTYIGEVPLRVGDTTKRMLSHFFEDPDGDALTYTAESSDETIAMVTEPDDNAMITITAVAKGEATILVTASDGVEGNASAQQTITVVVSETPPPPNNPPTVFPIPDEDDLEVGDTATVTLSKYAKDPEGDALTYGATSSNDAAATVSVSDGVLTITAVAAGTATITVTVSDGTNIVSGDFEVTVTAAPVPPPVDPNERPEQTLIDDIAYDELRRGGTIDLDLEDYYDDPDGDDLKYTADSRDDTIATVTDPGDGSMITIAGVGVGMTRITVSATDGKSDAVRQTFKVSVGSQAPMARNVSTQIPPLDIDDTHPVTLNAYFEDPEGDPLTFDTVSSSDETVATATEPDADSMITITAVGAGAATITVSAADSDNEPVELPFYVVVSDPAAVGNQPPQVLAGNVGDKDLHIGATEDLDLSTYFMDPDTGDTLTYATVSSKPAVATAEPGTGNMITITAVAVGETTITITATDNHGASTPASFKVTVSEPNKAPVSSGIPTQRLERDFDETEDLDLSDYFSDPDGSDDDLTYTAESSKPEVVKVSDPDANSMITITAVDDGEAMIKVTATDADGGVGTDTFTVTVSNPAVPTLKEAFRPVTFEHDGGPQTITLADHFNRATMYSATSDDPTVVEAAVNAEQTMLTLTRAEDAEGSTVVEITPSNSGGKGTTQIINVTVKSAPAAPDGVWWSPPSRPTANTSPAKSTRSASGRSSAAPGR